MGTAEPLSVPVWTQGERMAKTRRDVGYSQEELAQRLSDRLSRSISAASVSAWEADRNQPRDFMGVMAAWAELTAVPIGWLLTGETFNPGSFRTPYLCSVPPVAGQLSLDGELTPPAALVALG